MGKSMELGTFLVSLAVRDLKVSKEFYEKFGFSVFGGDAAQRWLIMKNGDTVIGLFQGMFEKNILTLTRDGMATQPGSRLLRTFAICNAN